MENNMNQKVTVEDVKEVLEEQKAHIEEAAKAEPFVMEPDQDEEKPVQEEPKKINWKRIAKIAGGALGIGGTVLASYLLGRHTGGNVSMPNVDVDTAAATITDVATGAVEEVAAEVLDNIIE